MGDTQITPEIPTANPFAALSYQPSGTEMGYNVEPGFRNLPYHKWWIKSPRGGVNIWAWQAHLSGFPAEWIGGVEVHYAAPPSECGWFSPDAPSHEYCWLLEAPCWHDGTSLYFSERIAPLLPHPDDLGANDYHRLPHDFIGFELIDWFSTRIATPSNGGA